MNESYSSKHEHHHLSSTSEHIKIKDSENPKIRRPRKDLPSHGKIRTRTDFVQRPVADSGIYFLYYI